MAGQNFFTPMIQEDPAIKRKQELAKILMTKGANGNAKSPYGALAQIMNSYNGSRMMKEGNQEVADRQQAAAGTMSDAMGAYRGDTPNYLMSGQTGPAQVQRGSGNDRAALLETMMSNPDTAGMASKMQMQQAFAPTDYKTATTGVPGSPGQRQEVYYPSSDPSKSKPLGSPYTAKAQTEINMGGQPNNEQRDERAENQAVADQVGAPLAIRAPWSGINDPKKRDEARIKYGMTADSKLEAMSKTSAEYAQTIGDIDRFLYLNESNYSGKMMDFPLAKTARSLVDAEFQEMQSLTDKMTPAMRNGLPGAASERDTAMFRSATLGVNKDPETNKNVGLGLKVTKKNALDMISYMKDFKVVNQHLEGSETLWSQYLEANPIFEPGAKAGSYKLNEGRISYKRYFSLPRPKTEQDMNKMKPGATYVDPYDGLMYRKP